MAKTIAPNETLATVFADLNNKVIIEAEWTGTLAIPVGNIPTVEDPALPFICGVRLVLGLTP